MMVGVTGEEEEWTRMLNYCLEILWTARVLHSLKNSFIFVENISLNTSLMIVYGEVYASV